MSPPSGEDWFAAGGFGVRRPLRFLAHKLELSEEQVVKLARILAELKTERAQAAVDNRRRLTELADALAADQFDAAKVAGVGDKRAETRARLAAAITAALEQIHALLTPEQRGRLAHLIRSGVIAL
ncbi:MAG TPA: Spy/CpxP family protein refolding chaperone [Tepidisphaeraceae bacterium]|nr:Spy/CpxP family protein refolding chaperone [Tepidisphaeraceae bacterium]